MITRPALALMLAMLMLASSAHASTYAVSVRGLGGRVLGFPQSTGRLGVEVDVLRAIDRSVGLGLGCGWFEEVGSLGFSYATTAFGTLQEQHQREFSIAGLARLGGKVMNSRPYLVVGAGGYLMIHRDRYSDGRFVSTSEYAPGLTAGVGISGSTWPTPVLEARWHRVFADSSPYDSTSKITDILLLSAGLSFN